MKAGALYSCADYCASYSYIAWNGCGIMRNLAQPAAAERQIKKKCCINITRCLCVYTRTCDVIAARPFLLSRNNNTI